MERVDRTVPSACELEQMASTLLALPGPIDDARGTKGTMLHGTKLSTMVWLAGMREFAQRSGRIRIADLQETCGVSYKTAWRMRGILRDAASLIQERSSSVFD